MESYKELYFKLFNQLTDLIEDLEAIQQSVEEDAMTLEDE